MKAMQLGMSLEEYRVQMQAMRRREDAKKEDVGRQKKRHSEPVANDAFVRAQREELARYKHGQSGHHRGANSYDRQFDQAYNDRNYYRDARGGRRRKKKKDKQGSNCLVM